MIVWELGVDWANQPGARRKCTEYAGTARELLGLMHGALTGIVKVPCRIASGFLLLYVNYRVSWCRISLLRTFEGSRKVLEGLGVR